MSRFARGILYGAGAVLAVAAVGSIASRALGFDYNLLAPIAFIIYAGVGAWVATADRVVRAAIAGGVVGVIDATAGWSIAYLVGPGRPQVGERITFLGLFNTTLFIAILAAATAAIGAWIVTWVRRRRAASAGPRAAGGDVSR